jgi:sugar O-acyltransferase (sialic acid O-acetyltransferase NeuD family)
VTISNQLLIIGCGGHTRFLLGLIANSHFEVFGLIDLRDDWDDTEVIMDVSVVGCLSSINKKYSLGWRNLALGIGNNYLRKRIYFQLKEMGFIFPNLIHPSAIIDTTAVLGEGNVIGPGVIIGAEVVLGNNNIINSGALIEHQCIIGDHCHVSLSATMSGNVSIGDCVFLGANSTVIERINVSNRTILGAGGTLVCSTKSNGLTLVGCPAKEKIK